MERIIEPELMEDLEQVEAYAAADFAEVHQQRITWFTEIFGPTVECATILDVGCGPCDVTLRFARALPDSRIVAVDGSQVMLDAAARLLAAEPALAPRVHLLRAYLPEDSLPNESYGMVMSHSALHHFHDPAQFWDIVRTYAPTGTIVFVSDLRRAASVEEAQQIVDQRAANEPPALQRDFTASLCAAFTVEEVEAQLNAAGLGQLKVQAMGEIYLLVSGVV